MSSWFANGYSDGHVYTDVDRNSYIHTYGHSYVYAYTYGHSNVHAYSHSDSNCNCNRNGDGYPDRGNAYANADLRPCRLAIGSAPASGTLCDPGCARDRQ